MRSIVFVAALSLLLVASWATAEPYVSVWGEEGLAQTGTSSWFGSVGLIVTPSALTPPQGGVTLAGHWIDTDPDATTALSVNFGLTKHIEVGGGWIDQASGDSTGLINVKVRVPAAEWLNKPGLPDIAIGAFDVSDEINRALYFVLSKSFKLDVDKADSPRINLHLGFADNEMNAGPLDGFFAGLEFNALKHGVVQAEFDAENFNADFRYNVTNKLSVDVGVLDGDLGAGATYRSNF